MKSIVKLTCVAAATLAVALPAAAEEETNFDAAAASSVRVLAINGNDIIGQGTGWVVTGPDKDNRAGASVIVTAGHVLNGASRIAVIPAGMSGSDLKATTVIRSFAEGDIAFLEVKDLNAKPITITRAVPHKGEEVFAAGFNTASDQRDSSSLAKTAAIKGGHLSNAFNGPMSNAAQAPVDQIEFDAPILPGYSGGPLLNKCGRAIGLTVKDGGHIALSPGVNIATGQGIDAALAADEIISAARKADVALTVSDAACGTDAAATPPPPPPCATAGTSVDAQGKPCTPLPPPPETTLTRLLRKPSTYIVIGLLGLVIALGAVWALMRGPRKTGMPAGGAGSHPIGEIAATPVPDLALPRPAVPTVRITGRGPNGEPIDFRFTADELSGTGVVMGVEGDGSARIPDNRAQPHVSRRHARLTHDGRNFIIEDNKSSNGTQVEGRRLEPHVARAIVNGDVIRLADVTLNVAID